ncbi:MAG: LPS export ABC transporter periplasmic protein LptC [Burkholderiaceae bacterium]|jgi:lipopolysaccharide export system protein LptC|nr:LPS export ABC transporter periplasmic protein LptC [Burkholderiaceae bacterium]
MRDRLSMLIAAILLALVTVTSYWYSREMRRPTARAPATPGTPSFIVDRLVLTQFDDSGQARYKLFAEQLSYFNENDDLDLTRPRLVSLLPDQPQLQASSARARVTNAGEKVLLEGDVLLQRAAAAGRPALTIRTERMTAIPDEERFASDVPVLIEQGGMRLAGSTMEYDNLARVLKLDGGLRGELAPARR